MTEWIINIVTRMGYPGVAILMLLETVFPPIPSELIMPLAGLQTARDGMCFCWAVASGTLGSVLGAVVLYVLARRIGEARLCGWVREHGLWIGVTPEDLTRAREWFERHGGWVVFFGRLVPGVRSVVSIPAGLQAMPFPPFLLYTTADSALWVGFLAYMGRILGRNYHLVERWLEPVAWLVLAVLVGPFLVRLVKHLLQGGPPRARPGEALTGERSR